MEERYGIFYKFTLQKSTQNYTIKANLSLAYRRDVDILPSVG